MTIDTSGPPLAEPSTDATTLLTAVRANATEHPDRALFSVRVGDRFVDRSAATVLPGRAAGPRTDRHRDRAG